MVITNNVQNKNPEEIYKTTAEQSRTSKKIETRSGNIDEYVSSADLHVLFVVIRKTKYSVNNQAIYYGLSMKNVRQHATQWKCT